MSSTFIRSSVKTPLPAFSVESLALLGTASPPATMSSPWKTLPMPSKMIMMPWPPASTTPAFFRTGEQVGGVLQSLLTGGHHDVPQLGHILFAAGSSFLGGDAGDGQDGASVGFMTAL